MAGIESLTYCEAIGWKGLMEAEHGNPLPDQFASRPGEIFPVYHVFHVLAGAKTLFQFLGAGGKMGCRLTANLRHLSHYQISYVEINEERSEEHFSRVPKSIM